MALKALLLKKQIDNRRKQLNQLLEKRTAHEAREAELTRAIEEVENEDQRAEVEGLVTEFESERDANEQAIANLEGEIEGLENDLAAEEAAQDTNPPANNDPQTPAETEERSVNPMNTRDIIQAMNLRDRVAGIVTRDNIKEYLSEIRTAIAEKRAVSGVGLTIPTEMLELIRYEVAHASRLLPFVNLRPVSGKARQNIMGKIPEAVWTEMCASLNELDLSFSQVEVDGYKVGAYIAICNAALEDSDVALATEIITAIGGAIAKALDKAIMFGDGVKKPVGIVTRLAQQSQPANWNANGPAWVDLHSTNVVTLNIDSSAGAAFFQALIEKLALAKPRYSADGLFWVMNRKTHLHIQAKALAFDSSAALVSNTDLMPIVGGTVVEFEDDEISDNEIIGGFGKNYLLAERAGVEFASSDLPLFLKDQTVFKGTARYDGQPVAGEAFVIVNFANTSPTTSKTFPTDYANAAMNDLTVTAAASASNVGKTVLTVSGTLDESTPVLKYKLGVPDVHVGDALPSGFADLTSGTTEIAAAAGKKITVVELDGNSRIVSAGVVASVPKAAG